MPKPIMIQTNPNVPMRDSQTNSGSSQPIL